MISWLAYPKPLVDATKDAVLTFVVPVENGCNLQCSYCVIRQRRELEGLSVQLTPAHYAAFIHGIARHIPVGCISVQGEEPLLDDSMPYTQAILKAAQDWHIPAAVITNGTHLAKQANTLAAYRLSQLTVSLDAATAQEHDLLRGVSGTFTRVLQGLAEAHSFPELQTSLAVASVLLPHKVDLLQDMPSLLTKIGIYNWFITPVIKIGQEQPGGPIQNWPQLVGDLQYLQARADQAGVKMIVEDEFNWLGEARAKMPELRPMRFRNLDRPEGVLRLLPSGACDVGHDLLREHNPHGSIWYPEREKSIDFYRRVLRKNRTLLKSA